MRARLLPVLTRDKSDTLLLLGAALLVLAPHAAHLPPWVSAVCAATLLWRAYITLRGTRLPPGLLLLPVALAAMAGVFATYRTLLGRDAGVAMLVLLVAFKMLEMHARRDLFVVIFLCFFLVLTNFFYSQSMGAALLMGAAVVALLTAQLSFQYTGAVPPLRQRLLAGAKIAGMAAPLALLLFLFFPRIEGPLWGLPGDAGAGRSGLSDSMAPGNISSLAQSDETAFRVRFDGAPPAQQQLYWRGIVLGSFDGRTWTRARPGLESRVAVTVGGRPVRHEVTLEPSGNRWLFALDLPVGLPQLEGNRASTSAELEMSAAYPVTNRVRYAVTSYPNYRVQAGPRLDDRARWLALPWGFNPRAMEAGRQLQRIRDPAQRAATVLAMFTNEQFVYTLEPPRLGRDAVDEFLYGTRAGFCEHYSGAFVFLMRAAGVPARVVTGYQGGVMNPVDGYLTVRQSDAHAWAEVWLPGRGWERVDPTAAVAPERVRRSVAQSLPRPDPFGIAGLGALLDLGVGEDGLLAQLRFQWSALNNGWNQWVLNYTPQRQRGLLAALQATLADWRTPAGLAMLAILLLFARAWRVRRQGDPIDALYSALCLQLGRRGMPRAAGEGPTAYARRISATGMPDPKKAAAMRFLELYSDYKYAAAAPDPRLGAILKSLLNESR